MALRADAEDDDEKSSALGRERSPVQVTPGVVRASTRSERFLQRRKRGGRKKNKKKRVSHRFCCFFLLPPSPRILFTLLSRMCAPPSPSRRSLAISCARVYIKDERTRARDFFKSFTHGILSPPLHPPSSLSSSLGRQLFASLSPFNRPPSSRQLRNQGTFF